MSLNATQLAGMFPALPTPFTRDGQVDTNALSALADDLIASGANGLVSVGGTGEYTAMAPEARTRAVAATVHAARGRVPVIAGVLSPGFQEALQAGQAFMNAGADGLLLVAPFYVKPTPGGIRSYFQAYARATGAPILLYDIPARTGVAVDVDTISGLACDGAIVGIKACNTDLNHFENLLRRAGDRIAVLSGDDYLCPIHMALGGHGGILASSVLLPRHWRRIAALAAQGRLPEALQAQRLIMPLLDALFAQINPGPLKAAMGLAGRPMGSVRLPLLDPDASLVARLADILHSLAALGIEDLATGA